MSPLSAQVRLPLYRILRELRTDWTDAECNAATQQLASMQGDAATLCVQALRQASTLRNERAITITWPVTAPTATNNHSGHITSPTENQVLCDFHGLTALRPDGLHACCAQLDPTCPPCDQILYQDEATP